MGTAETVHEVDESEEENEDKMQKRDSWQGKADFLLACIGCSVGLGNVWRFPYLCYKNGGGAFLIPYFVSVVVGGFPIFYLEMAVGQFMSRGGPQAWSIVPIFQGIGVASLVLAFLVSCYYNVILAWAFYYIVASFNSELPWERCGHDWNTPNCLDGPPKTANTTVESVKNTTDPVTEFWENKVLGITNGIEEPGPVKWDLALCLLFGWLVVFGCICKGIKSSGKVMYFTATSPYVFMFILVIRNCTLDGSADGIRYYLNANMTKLKETGVWVEAGTQIFFSWAVGLGAITALGSYNKFYHNSLRDSVIISVVNACTSFLSGFIVFSILGFMAKQQNVLVSDVAESGPGLAFIAYPKAIAQLPVSPLWSVLFFFMLILLGLDSQFVNVESVVTGVVDQYPHLLHHGIRKVAFVGAICLVMFVVGLSMVTHGGMYVLQIFDYYTGSRIIILVVLAEVVAVGYCYGARRFISNVRTMIGDTPVRVILPYLHASWIFFTPAFCLVMFALVIYNYTELTVSRPTKPTYTYPNWTVAFGWSMGIFAIVWIPLVAIYKAVMLHAMGGRWANGDFKLLFVPYFLTDQQRDWKANDDRCLADFEAEHRHSYGFKKAYSVNLDDETSVL